ncbi:MAG TPA: hypothetical protein VE733_01520 [Streptosporangiaceae bacterium]|jgi:hypothetical protein|nr:hypothetical protein [Streptosporangiaceae bacterium]
MSLDELRELLERHVRPDLTTAVDGVRICKADHTVSPGSSMSGTVLAVIAQGGKRLALAAAAPARLATGPEGAGPVGQAGDSLAVDDRGTR